MRYSGWRFGLLLLGTVGLIGAGAAMLWLPTYLEEREFLKYSEPYEDIENRFSFRFPGAWDLIPDWDIEMRNEKFVVGVYRPEVPSTAVGIIAEENSPFKKFDYEIFVKALEDNLSTNLKEFKKLSMRRVSLQGYPSFDISYTYKHLNAAYVRQRQLIVVTADAIYYLSGTSLVENYDRYKKELNSIFRTFKIEKKSSEINPVVK